MPEDKLDFLLNYKKNYSSSKSNVDLLVNRGNSQQSINKSIDELPTVLDNVVDYNLDPDKYETQFQSEFSDIVNSFRKGIDQTQISNYQGKSDAYQEIIDNNLEKQDQLTSLYKQGKLDPSVYEQELSIINQQNNDAQSKVNSYNQDIEDNRLEIKDEYVSKLYQMKEAAVQAKGGDSGLWESIKYTMPSIAGSSASLMGQQLAATFGTDLIKRAATAVTAGAIGGPVGEAVAIGGTIATTLGLLVNSRYQETMAELGGQLEQNQQQLLEKWQEDHPLSEPDENVLRKIRIEARKGKDNFVQEQMMLTIPDAIEATIMPGSKVFGAFKTGRRAEQSLKAITGYNNATRIGTILAKGYTNYLGEKFEEGYQYATGKRFASEALGLNEYENKDFMSNVLSDSYDVLSSISYGPWGTLQGDGRYSEDKEFQFAEQSGGLLAALSGGLASGIQISKDIKKFRDTNKDLQDSGIANPEDKFFRLKDQIYAKHFDKNTIEYLVEGVRNLQNQKNDKGIPMLTKQEAESEISNIKDAFEKYIEVSRHVEDIAPEGKFKLFKSKEQEIMLNAFKGELFHSSMQLTRHSKGINTIESVSNINDLIKKQEDLVSRIKNTVDNSTVRKTYNIDSRLKNAESKLDDLIKSKKSILDSLGITEKDLPKVSSVEESNKNKEYIIDNLNLTEVKQKYSELLEVNDNKSLEKWFKKALKRELEIKSDILPEEKVTKDFAEQQEQRTSASETQTEKPAETPVETTTTNEVPDDIQAKLDKLDKQENAELEALYIADPDNIDEAINSITEKYNKRRELITKKQSEEQAVEDNPFDDSQESQEKIPFLNRAIDSLFDLQGKLAKFWNKTIAGQDDDTKIPEQRYFRFLEKNNLPEGTSLQLITRKNNKKLFDELFDDGAKEYEEKTKIETIYAVFVDKDNNYIYAKQDGTISDSKDGKLVYANILTELGVDETLSTDDKETAKKELNKFRDAVLAQNKPVIVSVLKKSNGILIREKTSEGKRKSNPAIGYITTDITREGLLELPTIVIGKNNQTRLSRNGQLAEARKLYAYDDYGVGIDLIARNVNESEANLILNLIQQRLGNAPRQKEVEDIGKELDKLIHFGLPKGELGRYSIGIKEGNLYVGKNKVFTANELQDPENQQYVKNFLVDFKYVNANSKIPFNSAFREPFLNSEGKVDFKDWNSYQEFLLSNEGGREHLFGTDIPALGKPKFRNYYVTYDTNITTDSIEVKESEIKPDLTPEYSTDIKLEDNKKDDTKNLDNKEKSSTFVDSKEEEDDFEESGLSRNIDINDDEVDKYKKHCE